MPPEMNTDNMIQASQEASLFLKALANPNRLMILCVLMDQELSVSALENLLSMRQPTLSQQLARLREDDLVSTRRDGKSIYYQLSSDKVRQTVTLMHDLFCKPTGS